MEPYQKHIPSQGNGERSEMTVKNFNESSAVRALRTEMGVKITLGTKTPLSDKQVDGWFELEAAEQFLAELQTVIAAVRAGE